MIRNRSAGVERIPSPHFKGHLFHRCVSAISAAASLFFAGSASAQSNVYNPVVSGTPTQWNNSTTNVTLSDANGRNLSKSVPGDSKSFEVTPNENGDVQVLISGTISYQPGTGDHDLDSSQFNWSWSVSGTDSSDSFTGVSGNSQPFFGDIYIMPADGQSLCGQSFTFKLTGSYAGASPESATTATVTFTVAGGCASSAGSDLDSVHSRFDLGAASCCGRTAAMALLSWDQGPSADIVSPATLAISGKDRLVEIIPEDPEEPLRQVLSKTALVDIVTGTNGYEMKYYLASQKGTKTGDVYAPTGSPYKTVKVENPGGNPNKVRITREPTGGNEVIEEFEWISGDGNWTLRKGDDSGWLTTERLQSSTSGNYRTDIRTTSTNGTSGITSVVETTYRKYGFGERVVQEVVKLDGTTGLTTTWDYYDNPGAGGSHSASVAGEMKSVVRPDGSWEKYEYDSQGRMTKKVAGFQNIAFGTETGARKWTYSYSETNPVETEVETVGTQEVARRYLAKYPEDNETRIIRAAAPGGAWDAESNHVETTVLYGEEDDFPNRTKSQTSADGTIRLYAYSEDEEAGEFTTVEKHGVPNEGGTDITEGTITTTVQNGWGETIERTVEDKVTEIVLESQTATAVDALGRPTSISHLGGLSESKTYGCCLLDSETGTDRVANGYGYDAIHRRTSTARNGIIETQTLDASGRATLRTRTGTDTSSVTLQETTYDRAGRVVQTEDGEGGITTYAYTFPGVGGLTTTTTYPDEGTRVETTYADGRMKEISGTAAHPMKYEYGTWSGGEWTKEIKVGEGASETEWTKTYTDALGQTVKVEYPDAAFSEMFYDGRGNLIKQIDPDGVTTMFAYDGRNRRTRHAVDLNGNGQINLATDRITETAYEVDEAHGTDVERTTTKVYATPSSSTPTTVSMVERSTDGLKSWQTLYNAGGAQVTESVQSVPTGGDWSVTTTAPDGTQRVQTYEDGRLVSSEQLDANEDPVTSSTYAYDPHGRVASVTDARTGAVAYTYDDRDLVLTETRPTPDGDVNPLVTTYAYDEMGRRTSVTLPDTTVTSTTYTARGEVSGTSGSQTYTVDYSYDPQGRMRTMTTHQSGESAQVTEWVYDGQRGWLTKKVYDSDGSGVSQATPANQALYTYTDAGKLETRDWARGITTTYGYNAAGDLESVDYSDATADVTTTYKRWGGVDTVTDGAGTRSMYYGDQFEVKREIYAGNIDRDLHRTYDSKGRPLAIAVEEISDRTDPDDPTVSNLDHQISYGYDDAGRLETVVGHGTTHTYSYLSNSNLIAGMSSTSPSGFAVVNTYDTKRDVLLSKENKVGATTISKYDYAVNRIGQRTEREQSGTAFSATNADAFTYNSRGEVTGAANDTITGRAFTYAFDGIGNRTEATELGVTTGYTANNLNAYTELGVGMNTYEPEHDADGNQTKHFRQSDGKEFALVWDGENRLLSFTPASPSAGDLKGEYEYDGQSRRVRKVLSEWSGSAWLVEKEERFFYDSRNMVAVYDDTEDLVETYTWGLDLSGSLQGAGGVGGLLSRKPDGGSAAFYTYDGNGNVSEVIDGSGSVIAHYEYGPFGQVLSATGTLAATNRFQFSTKWQDVESDFNYYGYRSYNPETGRWLNRDPIGEAGGENLYVVLGNAAVDRVDWLGLFCICEYVTRVEITKERPFGANGANGTFGHNLEIRIELQYSRCNTKEDTSGLGKDLYYPATLEYNERTNQHSSNPDASADSEVDNSDVGRAGTTKPWYERPFAKGTLGERTTDTVLLQDNPQKLKTDGSYKYLSIRIRGISAEPQAGVAGRESFWFQELQWDPKNARSVLHRSRMVYQNTAVK